MQYEVKMNLQTVAVQRNAEAVVNQLFTCSSHITLDVRAVLISFVNNSLTSAVHTITLIEQNNTTVHNLNIIITQFINKICKTSKNNYKLTKLENNSLPAK